MDTAITKSYRLTEDIHEKIREIANEIGGSQQQTISKLIECYELQKGKAVLTEKKDDIETFENYITSLTRMYMVSLEDNQNVKELVRAEFNSQLTSKDNVIQDLQQQLADAKKTEQNAVADTDMLKASNDELHDCIDKLRTEHEATIHNLEDILSEKEKLNTALAETVEQQKSQITDMKTSDEEVKTLRAEIERYQNMLSGIKKDMEQQQLQHERDMLALEKKLQDEKTTEIEKYQKLYFDMIQEKKTTKNPRKKPSSTNNTDNESNG